MPKAAWKDNPVPYYLMACYAYEVLGEPIMSDYEFDMLGKHLDDWWDIIEHRHKCYIEQESCAYTSAINVPYAQLPAIIHGATHQLLGTDFKTSPIYEDAMAQLKMRVALAELI